MMNNELYHHGIKGQKWGVRRFQNSDGSLTQEGYQHYGLNPDGSRSNRGKYSPHTKSVAKKGMLVGAGLGVAAGVALTGGAAGILTAGLIGQLSGATVGTAVGAVQTKKGRKKIASLLKENGTVYVKDL